MSLALGDGAAKVEPEDVGNAVELVVASAGAGALDDCEIHKSTRRNGLDQHELPT